MNFIKTHAQHTRHRRQFMILCEDGGDGVQYAALMKSPNMIHILTAYSHTSPLLSETVLLSSGADWDKKMIRNVGGHRSG